MTFDPKTHHRRSIRRRGFDYSEPGAYFVTICTHEKQCLFGNVVGGKVQLADAGRMVQEAWYALPNHYPRVDLDAFVIMPNHVHGIIVMLGRGQARGPAPTTSHLSAVDRFSLSDVIQRFKSFTTSSYIREVQQNRWPALRGTLWQRNFFDRIIRNPKEFSRIQKYILENPARWEFDRENPHAKSIPNSATNP